MTVEFHVQPDPSEAFLANVAAWAPADPFCTAAYIKARSLLGYRPYGLMEREDGEVISGFTAMMESGHLGRRLIVSSLQPPIAPEAFWEGVIKFCRLARVWELDFCRIAANDATIPQIAEQNERKTRPTYILDLSNEDLWAKLSQNHRRRNRRAQKAGIDLRCMSDVEDCRQHALLQMRSMARRTDRGEAVPEVTRSRACSLYLQTGAGKIFEAVRDGEVLSSCLVLIAEKGAYYHSGGSSAEGMNCGSSHFLIHEISKTLQADSIELFNLGRVNEGNEGLERFKIGFGTERFPTEDARFFLGNQIRRRAITAARQIRRVSLKFLRW